MKKYRKILLCCSVVLIGAVTAVTYRSFADSNNDRNTDISDVAEIKKDLSQQERQWSEDEKAVL